MTYRQLLSPIQLPEYFRHTRKLITTSCINRKDADEQQHIVEQLHMQNAKTGSDIQFMKEFQKNNIKITNVQRTILTVGSTIAALTNPHRHDMVACLGETTGIKTLTKLLKTMKESSEGTEILLEKPRINSSTIDLKALGELPTDTFGYAYKKFLDDNNVTPDSRMPVKFINDPELVYVMTRYRECHDLLHAVFGMPTNMLGEVTLKWIEAINIGLPMCYVSAIFGAIRLRPKQRENYRQHFLRWALNTKKIQKPLITVYWEKRWTQSLSDLRQELNITTLDFNKLK